jgi:superfamily II DNA/RNA helicase
LVSELEQVFLGLFGDLGFRVSSVTGTFESDDFQERMIGDADVLVMTPEKADLLQRAKPEFLDRVRLIILDEGQIVDDPNRGVKFELLLTRLKKRLRDARFLFLSAVVPMETLEDFAKWFSARPQEDVMVYGWRPSVQRFGKFEWQGTTGVLRYVPSEDAPLLQEFVPGVIRERTYEFVNPDTGRVIRRRFPERGHKGQTAGELAFKFSDLGPVLVFCSQPRHAMSVGESLNKRLDLAERVNERIPQHFHVSSPNRSLDSAREWLGTQHPVTRLLERGIAVHYGDLPEVVRKSIETDFRERRLRILVATNTLAQGVNLPIRTVVVHSVWRHGPEGQSVRIKARDYWNIAGRAGRAREETEGTVIHIVLTRNDERDFRYYLEKRESVEPVRGALSQLLEGLVNQRISDEAAREQLDPEILALLAEEGAEMFSDEALQSLLQSTLVGAQSGQRPQDLSVLQHVVRMGAEMTASRVATGLWRVYSSTGLSTDSCEILRLFTLENQERVLRLLEGAAPANLEELIGLLLEACSQLPEMQSDREIADVNYADLLRRWVTGFRVDDLAPERASEPESLGELSKFVEEYFGVLLPWGISAFIRIAQGVLGLAPASLSPYVAYISTMVKFGVPRPEAAWAMTAGVPFRQTAINLAERYVHESREPSQTDFLRWLSSVETDDLRNQLNLPGPFFEDVTRAVFRSSINPILTEHSETIEILPHDTWIRGIGYEGRAVAAGEARPGQVVQLRRDYDNVVDRNAIRVELNGQSVGYVERQFAQLAAPDMDCGLALVGEIVRVERGRIPQVLIRIDLVAE